MPFTAAQLTTDYQNANLGITPSAAESLLIQAYAQQDANGSLTDTQTLNAVLALSSDKTDVAVMTYQYFTGSMPTLAGLAFLVHGGGNPNDLSSAYYAGFNQENRYYNFSINLAFGSSSAAAFASTYGSLTLTQTIQAAYENIVGSSVVGAAHAAAAEAFFASNISFYQAIAAQRAGGFNQDLATKAIIIGSILNEAVKANVGTYAQSLDLFLTQLATTGTATAGVNLLTAYPALAVGQNITLTSGIDTFAGGNGNDTVNATDSTGTNQLTTLDNINGGGGNNVLNFNAIGALNTTLATDTVANFQTVNMAATGAITTNTTAWTGLLTLTALSTGGATITSGSATNVTETDGAQAAAAISVNGGNNVTVTGLANTGGTITVGGTTAPVGAVNVTEAVTAAAGAQTGGAITVTGGTTDTVTVNLSNGTVATTNTAGTVTVNGKATTTSVSVSETAAVTASGTVAGLADNTVTINDVNNASATKAGTITSVSLSNVASATIADNALANLSLTGSTASGTGVITVTDSLTTPTQTSLNMTLNNFKGGFTDTNNELATLNVTTTGTGSTFSAITDTNANLALNVTGATGGVTLTTAGVPANLKTLTVGGAAFFTGDISGTAVTSFAPTSTGTITATLNGTTQAFTGGAGTDVITLNGAVSKAIAGGTASNNEVILNSAAGVVTASGAANISGFQTLGLGAASTGIYDISTFTKDTFSTIDVQATTASVTLNNVTAGTALLLSSNGTTNGSVVYSTADKNGGSDSVAVSLGSNANTTNQAIISAGNQLTLQDTQLDGIGTVVFHSLGKAQTTAVINTIDKLSDTGATVISFDGNASTTINTLQDISNTVSIANASSATNVTETIGAWVNNNLKSLTLSNAVALSFNGGSSANGLTVNGASDNANVTMTLNGAAAAASDSIALGNGVDSITTGAAGATTITLGTGTGDTVNFTNAGATGAQSVTAIGTHADTVTESGSGNHTVSLANGGGTVTITGGVAAGVLGAGAPATVDTVTLGGIASTVSDTGNGTMTVTASDPSTVSDTVTLTGTGTHSVTLGNGASDSVTISGGLATFSDTVVVGGGNDSVSDSAAGTVNITLGGGNDSVTANGGTGTYTVNAGNGSDTINLGSSTHLATVTVGTGGGAITTGSGGSGIVVGATGTHNETITLGAGANSVTLGAHTTGVDSVSAVAQNTAAAASISAVITGLNSSATTSDTIKFGTDGAAAGAVTVVTTAQINAYAASSGQDPTILATAVNAVLDATHSGIGLAQHGIAAFSFQGNTYLVEQADLTGHSFATANEAVNSVTVVELVGTVPVTAASTAAAGTLTLHG